MREAAIALVEDEESLCRSLERLLRAYGLRSFAYPSAEAFLADPAHARYECLIVDIQLGGMSGIELAERLAASGWSTPVIFMTAYDDPAMRELALATGCAAYLRKNDSGEVVLDALRQAMR